MPRTRLPQLSVHVQAEKAEKEYYCGKIKILVSLIVILSLLVIHLHIAVPFTLKSLNHDNFSKFFHSFYDHAGFHVKKEQQIPFYFVNLDNDLSRYEHTVQHLQSLNYYNLHRISAWTLKEVEERVHAHVTSVPNVMKPNLKELACIASHIHAMFLAVYENNTFPYAIIMEDDIRFEMKVDLLEMIKYAPKDFSILQLTTSNSEKAPVLWQEYTDMLTNITQKRNIRSNSSLPHLEKPQRRLRRISAVSPEEKADSQWYLRKWDSALWSTQAYLINKEKIKERIHQLLAYNNATENYHIHLNQPPSTPCLTMYNSLCLLAYRIVADIYLYDMFSPTYMTRVPFITGAGTHAGFNETSSIQDENKVKNSHLEHFALISQLIHNVTTTSRSILPHYFFPLR
jgi:GR25 family glycosyltransferase involved in LPS biosynthesis